MTTVKCSQCSEDLTPMDFDIDGGPIEYECAKCEMLRRYNGKITAWNLVGFDNWSWEGRLVRVKGGRTWYDMATISKFATSIVLSRIDPAPEGRIKLICRYVHPDTEVELSPPPSNRKRK